MLFVGGGEHEHEELRMTPNDSDQASQWACNGRGLLIVIWKWIVKPALKMLTSRDSSDGYSQRKQIWE